MPKIRWGTARPVLESRDIERSKAFYCDLLGFEAAVAQEGYLLLRQGDAEIAVERSDSPSLSEVVIHVYGIEPLFARCSEAGCVSVQLHTHESARRDFIAKDPDGNRIRIVEPVRHGARVVWVDLTVEEAAKVRPFWSGVLGLDGVQETDMGGYSDYTLTADGKPVLGVCHKRGANASIPPVLMTYFAVDDLEAALAEVIAHGGSILERRETMAIVSDPAGVTASLYQA